MSINVNLTLRVTGIQPEATAGVIAALNELFVRERLDGDVVLAVQDGPAVVGTTPFPLIISAFYRWSEPFENAVRAAAAAVAPTAVVDIDWGFPDEP